MDPYTTSECVKVRSLLLDLIPRTICSLGLGVSLLTTYKWSAPTHVWVWIHDMGVNNPAVPKIWGCEVDVDD